MTVEVPDGYGDGELHGWLSNWCGLVEAIARSRAAEELLERDDLPASGGLFAPPMWMWQQCKGLGRKSRARDGGTLLTPVRVKWHVQALHAVDHQTSIPWEACMIDEFWSGASTVVLSPDVIPAAVPSRTPESTIEVEQMSRTEMVRALHGYVQDGHRARWEALEILQPMLERSLLTAHSYLSKDVSTVVGGYRALLDDIMMETIRDEMMFGDADAQAPSVVSKIMDTCLDEGRFDKVEPLHYLRITLRRSAQEAVRRAIGDPHNGSRIRAVAVQADTRNPEVVRDLYNEGAFSSSRPSDQVGLARVQAALTIVPVTARPFDPALTA